MREMLLWYVRATEHDGMIRPGIWSAAAYAPMPHNGLPISMSGPLVRIIRVGIRTVALTLTWASPCLVTLSCWVVTAFPSWKISFSKTWPGTRSLNFFLSACHSKYKARPAHRYVPWLLCRERERKDG